MRGIGSLRRIGVVGAAMAAAIGLGVAPASAADLGDDGTAYLGSVLVEGANPVNSGQLGLCDVTGQQGPTTTNFGGVAYPGVSFGTGKTQCLKDGAGHNNIKLTGNKFELSMFNKTEYGRRLIRVRSFETLCTSTENGTSVSFKLNGISGVTVPSSLPPNYTVMVPGKLSSSPPVAKVIFNISESHQGAIALTAMRIELDPTDGYGALGGTIDVGVTACAPTW